MQLLSHPDNTYSLFLTKADTQFGVFSDKYGISNINATALEDLRIQIEGTRINKNWKEEPKEYIDPDPPDIPEEV